MQLLIRHNTLPLSSKFRYGFVTIEWLSRRVGVTWLEVFLAIETGSLNKGVTSLRRRGQQNKVSRKQLLFSNFTNISSNDFTPLDLLLFAISNHPTLAFMIQRLIRTVTSIVFVACVNSHLPSRSIEIPSTTIRGPQAVRGPRGLIAGIVCSTATTRK